VAEVQMVAILTLVALYRRRTLPAEHRLPEATREPAEFQLPVGKLQVAVIRPLVAQYLEYFRLLVASMPRRVAFQAQAAFRQREVERRQRGAYLRRLAAYRVLAALPTKRAALELPSAVILARGAALSRHERLLTAPIRTRPASAPLLRGRCPYASSCQREAFDAEAAIIPANSATGRHATRLATVCRKSTCCPIFKQFSQA